MNLEISRTPRFQQKDSWKTYLIMAESDSTTDTQIKIFIIAQIGEIGKYYNVSYRKLLFSIIFDGVI